MRESGQGYWMKDDIAGTLRAEGEDRPSRPSHVIGVSVVMPEIAGTMKACKDSGGWSNSADHAAAGYMVPVAFHPTQDPISSTEVCHSIGTSNGQGCATAAVAVDTYNHTVTGDYTGSLTTTGGPPLSGPGVLQAMQVRRLTPVECERLQGFPDGYTAIPWRGRPASECPDGPRYKALGNSWAVPVVRWIGRRINERIGNA